MSDIDRNRVHQPPKRSPYGLQSATLVVAVVEFVIQNHNYFSFSKYTQWSTVTSSPSTVISLAFS